ncbi:hypothetical protein MTO96_035157 [Rhipicephalus appendiculatus]
MGTTPGRRGGGGRCYQRSHRQAPLKIPGPPSQIRSRTRSPTPGPRKQQQRRARSCTPGGTPMSFADAVKGKRAPTAEAGGKTDTRIETEITQLTQAIHTMQKQIERMQAQIHAKDELIQQLQSAANSETDPQAMQDPQEELIEDDEVEGPDTKRRPASTLTKAVRPKRTRAAIRDARLEALEAHLGSSRRNYHRDHHAYRPAELGERSAQIGQIRRCQQRAGDVA